MSYYEHKGEKLEIFGAAAGSACLNSSLRRWAMTCR